VGPWAHFLLIGLLKKNSAAAIVGAVFFGAIFADIFLGLFTGVFFAWNCLNLVSIAVAFIFSAGSFVFWSIGGLPVLKPQVPEIGDDGVWPGRIFFYAAAVILAVAAEALIFFGVLDSRPPSLGRCYPRRIGAGRLIGLYRVAFGFQRARGASLLVILILFQW